MTYPKDVFNGSLRIRTLLVTGLGTTWFCYFLSLLRAACNDVMQDYPFVILCVVV